MKYQWITVIFLTFSLIACSAPNTDNGSWSESLKNYRSYVTSVMDNVDPNTLTHTNIQDIKWSLLYDEDDENQNSIGLKIEIMQVYTNTYTTLTYLYRNAVPMEDTDFMLLASENDLQYSPFGLNPTKILRLYSSANNGIISSQNLSGNTENNNTEDTATRVIELQGTIQAIQGPDGLPLMNALRNPCQSFSLESTVLSNFNLLCNRNQNPIPNTFNIGKTEAFFLLRLESLSPQPEINNENTIFYHTTDLVQRNADGTWTTKTITNHSVSTAEQTPVDTNSLFINR